MPGLTDLTVLAHGGYATVYRATQTSAFREVAVKVILPAYANHPEFIRRFEAEAQIVARLEHPHIVPLYDFWREPDGAYLVMRYMRGGSLDAALSRLRVLHLHGVEPRHRSDHRSLAYAAPAQLDAVLGRLLAAGYDGVVCLEIFEEDDFHSSLAALEAAVRRVRGERAGPWTSV